MTHADFSDAVLSFCILFEASETSGFRTGLRNEKVGGVPLSAHRVGLGKDVVYDSTPPNEATAKARAQSLGLKLIREEGHDHLQPWEWLPG